MKKQLLIIALILTLLLGTACGKTSSGGEGGSRLNISQSDWNEVDHHNFDKVSQSPTFTIDKNAEECKIGMVPFAFFSDGMVLQRNAVNRVYGFCDYDGGVAVEIDGKIYYGSAADGEFEVYLPPVAEGENLTMTIYGKSNKVTVRDVCYGEVLLFSGQSNMNWRMTDTISGTWPNETPGKQFLSYYGVVATPYVPTLENDPQTYYEYIYTKELADTYRAKAEGAIEPDENIRLMLLENYYPQDKIAQNKTPRKDYDLDKKWQKADTRGAILECSMFAYYFVKNLRAFTGVPVGIIVASFGATDTSAWVDRQTYENNKAVFPDIGDSTVFANSVSSCYNTFIAPMLGYKFRSFIWYQGEGECSGANYGAAFSALVNSYRETADNPNMKVLVVSLPQFGNGARYPAGYSQSNYGTADKELGMENGIQTYGRANQQKLPEIIENCAVSVSVNTGDFDDIHPSDKEQISYQAACSYLADLYGFKDVVLLYPAVSEVAITDELVRISFENLGDGLQVRNNGIGFQVSENGKDYIQTRGVQEGDSIVLRASAAGIETINYIRYGWLQFPRISRTDAEKYVSVFNSYGMPLDQFEICVADWNRK